MPVTAELVQDEPGLGPAAGADGAADAAAGGASAIPPWALRAAFVLAVAPLAVAALHLLVAQRTYPTQGDLAMTEMLTRDVGHRWLELGPYSRDGWYHPGPAIYYVLAVPYRLLGSTAASLDAGALLVNGASVVGMGLIARRRGGPVLALLTLVGCALLMRSLGADPTQLPWNPWLTVLPYGLLVFLTVALACGDRWALPVAVGVASFEAQSHVAFMPLALPLVVVGAGWLVAATPKAERRRRLALPALVATAVAAVMWLPVAVQQLANDPGNLGLTVKWFRTGGPRHEQGHPLAAGWRLVSAQYATPPEWLTGMKPLTNTAEPMALYRPLVPGLLVLVAVAAVLLWRRRVAGARPLIVVWLVASLVGIVATARTAGPIFNYRMGFAWMLGMLGGVLVAWAAWRALCRWRPGLERRLLVPAGLVVLAALAVVSSVAHVQHGTPDPVASHKLARLIPEVRDALPSIQGAVIIDADTFGGAGYADGLLLALERRGYDARLTPGNDFVGRQRVYDGGPVRARLLVTSDLGVVDSLADHDLRLVAYAGELSLPEVERRAAATRVADTAFRTGDFGPLQRLGKHAKFIPPRSTVAVFAERDPGPS